MINLFRLCASTCGYNAIGHAMATCGFIASFDCRVQTHMHECRMHSRMCACVVIHGAVIFILAINSLKRKQNLVLSIFLFCNSWAVEC